MTETNLELRRVELRAHVLRLPISQPVRTSFGTMHDRPAVLVQARDADGAEGWGEAWCNFPPCGAEHRGRLIDTVLSAHLREREFESPAAAFAHLHEATAVLALQSGEPGPFAQAIAGVDLALWDLVARRNAQPLWRLLGGSDPTVGVYASGINPEHPERVVRARRDDGYRAFKLKIGFGTDIDIPNIERVVEAAGDGATVMVDANQAWSLEQALRMAVVVDRFDLAWIEEPLRADRPWSEWQELQRHSRTPLAAGENVAGARGFEELLASGAVRVVQPDVAKWGGISGCLPVVRRIRAQGATYAPHFLGAGIGLLHSAHLLAATGGGMLEVDSNPNALRSLLCGPLARPGDGRATLTEVEGIGVHPDIPALRELCAASRSSD